MRKIVTIFVAIFAFSLAGYAQLMTANTYTRKARPHNVWLDVSGGSFTTSVIGSNVKTKGACLGVSLRWTVPFGEIFTWDVIDLGADLTFPTNFSEDDPDPFFYLMTGPRIRFEVIEQVLHVYAAANAGVSGFYLFNYGKDDPNVGFISEYSAGIMIKKRFHIGAYLRNFPSYKVEESGYKFNSLGAKMGFSF